MIYPKYDFNDPNLNYNDVKNTVMQMYSDLNSQGNGCCKSKSIDDILCQVDGLLQAMSIDLENNDTDRYNLDVKSAYLLLSDFFRLSTEVSPTPIVPFPSNILDQIARGNEYLSDLNSEYISDLQKGCDCMPLQYVCLKRIMRSLEYKVELEEYDDISIILVNKMMVIIGSPKLVRGYWGVKSDSTILSYSDIILGTPINFVSGSSIDIPYNFTNAFPWFAIPGTEPIKTDYIDLFDQNNSGEIGTNQDYMNYPTLVDGEIPLNFYVGNYITTQLTTLRFLTTQ